MPAWLVQAAAQVTRFLFGTRGRALSTGTAIGGLAAGVGIPGIDLFPDDEKRRRRRRRALTASDRADIAFVTATLGQAAGKSFAMLVVSRTTA